MQAYNSFIAKACLHKLRIFILLNIIFVKIRGILIHSPAIVAYFEIPQLRMEKVSVVVPHIGLKGFPADIFFVLYNSNNSVRLQITSRIAVKKNGFFHNLNSFRMLNSQWFLQYDY